MEKECIVSQDGGIPVLENFESHNTIIFRFWPSDLFPRPSCFPNKSTGIRSFGSRLNPWTWPRGLLPSTACFSKVNRAKACRRIPFPASFCRYISIAGVGNIGEDFWGSPFNALGVGNPYAVHSTWNHQPDFREDSVDPGILISGPTKHSPDNSLEKDEWCQAWVASSAFSMVAGAAGRILSHQPLLIPRQVDSGHKMSF